MAYKKKSNYSAETIAERSKVTAESVSKTFIEAIQEGSAPWMKPWKPSGVSDEPFNPITKTVYSGTNNMYLSIIKNYILKSEDPRFMTFVNAAQNDMRIKAGSKGFPIVYFGVVALDKNGKPIPENKKDLIEPAKFGRTLKGYTVFHASQIEGIPPLTQEPPVIDFVPIEKAEMLIKNTNANITHDQKDRNYYIPAFDEIHLCKPNYFNSPEAYYSTALHELSHWTGHKDRLNRKNENFYGTPEYAREELRAEIGSYMLCKSLKLDFSPQNSQAYVASWCKLLSNNPQEIYEACREGENIVSFIHSGGIKKDISQEVTNTTENKLSVAPARSRSR